MENIELSLEDIALVKGMTEGVRPNGKPETLILFESDINNDIIFSASDATFYCFDLPNKNMTLRVMQIDYLRGYTPLCKQVFSSPEIEIYVSSDEAFSNILPRLNRNYGLEWRKYFSDMPSKKEFYEYEKLVNEEAFEPMCED